MDNFEKPFRRLPPETQAVYKTIWDSIPASEKSALGLITGSLPGNSNLLRMLVRISAQQVKAAFGKKARIAIVGPANVGKSTLYNQLVQNSQDHALVGPLPGTTRSNQAADAGLFTVVDTPGADAVGYVGEEEKAQALEAAQEADFLIVVFDALQGIKQTELSLYQEVRHRPHIVVLNKSDLVKRHSQAVLQSAADNLGVNIDQVIPISAKNGTNLDQVFVNIAMMEPEITAALGQGLPQYRRKLAWQTITSGATGSAVIALTPLPVIDFIPLVTIQSIMVLGIARIYNYEITLQRARELVATFGLGFLGRTLFYELSKLGGIPGWLLGVAIAVSMSISMGYAAMLWFEKGEQLSKNALDGIIRKSTASLLSALKDIGKKKPSKEILTERLEQILSQTESDMLNQTVADDSAKPQESSQ